MGDYKIHRVRFFSFTPKPIQCMAYEDTNQKLAVARQDTSNGRVEIYDVREKWLLERTLLPTKSVEAVVWCLGRLFSAGLHGDIHEHDLETGGIKSSSPSFNGAIWCLTINASGTKIAAGTEDGCVVLFDVLPNEIQYDRALDKQEGRILSIAWHDADNAIVTGGIDNIRVWSVTSGRAIQRMTVGRGTSGNKETIVWAVAVTPDFTIVSGDSRGKTCFWNGRMGTRIKSFKSHNADVYTVCVSPDGKTAFSSGVDPQVVRFQLTPCLGPDSDWPVWVKGSSRCLHTNDVRALLYARDCIISAGLDCQLIVSYLGGKRSKTRTLRISPIPLSSTVQTIPDINGVMFRYPDKLELWKLGSSDATSDVDMMPLSLKSSPVKLLEIQTKVDSCEIICSAVSRCGSWAAYSDNSSVKLFSLSLEELDSGSPVVSATRVNCLPVSKRLGAHCLTFTPDGTKLVVASRDGSVQLIKIDDELPTVAKIFTMPEGSSGQVHLLAVSACGRYLAVAQLCKSVHVYDLKKLRHHWTLPNWTNQATAMSFNPTSPDLVVVYSDRKIVEYMIKEREHTAWSRTVADYFHPQWSLRPNKIRSVSFHPKRPDEVLLRDDELFFIINKTQTLPEKSVRLLPPAQKRDASGVAKHALHVCDQFKYLMHVDILPDGMLVIVERPQQSLVEALPAPIKQKKFGV